MTKSKSSGKKGENKLYMHVNFIFQILCIIVCCICCVLPIIILVLSKIFPSIIGYPIHAILGKCDSPIYRSKMQDEYEKTGNKYVNPKYCDGFFQK